MLVQPVRAGSGMATPPVAKRVMDYHPDQGPQASLIWAAAHRGSSVC